MTAIGDLLFLSEAAAIARVSVSTVRHWIASGKLSSLRPGKHRMVRRRALEALLTESETTVAPKQRKRRNKTAMKKEEKPDPRQITIEQTLARRGFK